MKAKTIAIIVLLMFGLFFVSLLCLVAYGTNIDDPACHENMNRLTSKWVRPLTDILCAVPIIAGIVFLVWFLVDLVRNVGLRSPRGIATSTILHTMG